MSNDVAPKLLSAEDNAWYCLATVHGQEDEKNRIAWNRWMAAGLSEEQRESLTKKGFPPSELVPFSDDERVEFLKVYAARTSSNPPPPKEPISFLDLKIPNKISFSGFVFPSHTLFNRSNFVDTVLFDKSEFLANAVFDYCTFIGGVSFTAAHFSALANFFLTTFTLGAYFSEAIFSVGLFNCTIFEKAAYFGKTKFETAAIFMDSRFDGSAFFMDTIFSPATSFRGATFSGEAGFYTANFRDSADFSKVIFGKDAKFSGAIFAGNVDFSESEFKSSIDFQEAKFQSAVPKFFDCKLREGILLAGSSWPPPPKDMPAAQLQAPAYERLKSEMERLKRQYEYQFFFTKELRALRETEPPYSILRLVDWAYLYFSVYGFSVGRPLFWIAVLFLVGGGYFALTPTYDAAPMSFFDSLGFSFENLIPLLPFRFDKDFAQHLTTSAKIFGNIQSMLGGVLLFLTALALRNRFRTK